MELRNHTKNQLKSILMGDYTYLIFYDLDRLTVLRNGEFYLTRYSYNNIEYL